MALGLVALVVALAQLAIVDRDPIESLQAQVPSLHDRLAGTRVVTFSRARATALADRLAAARAALGSIFGYGDFRPGQAEIVAAVLAGEDVLAVMPTGSGKSMCYQLPAIVDGALTVVVSPLIALMRDQVQQMRGFGVAAATLNSATGDDEARETWRLLREKELRLLFVSPERLQAEGLAARLRDAGVRRLAIDEAHCVSQWGHDFRPEYRSIGRARRALGDVQTLAFTATADKATREDVAERLFEGRPRVFLHSFDRPNIALRFEPKDQPRRQLAEFVAGHKGESGIVYCASRLRTESLAENLGRRGVRALAYHAGMDQGARSRNQDAFLQEDGVVMVATVAFGMGINKPDVRFVCHADMPANVESYYQEIGRAGRDGLPADTLTLYGFDDMALRRRQIAEKDIADERRQSEMQKARGDDRAVRGRDLPAPGAARLFRRGKPGRLRPLRPLPRRRAARRRHGRRPEGALGGGAHRRALRRRLHHRHPRRPRDRNDPPQRPRVLEDLRRRAGQVAARLALGHSPALRGGRARRDRRRVSGPRA